MSMTDMAGSTAVAIPRSEYEAFLLASIGPDSSDNGMQLSVLSALARQNVDPWEEAALLACLPRETAKQKLSVFIASLPKGRATRADPGADAARLIALLPREVPHPTQWPMVRKDRGTDQRWPFRQVAMYLIAMLVVLAVQWLVATHVAAETDKKVSVPTTGIASSLATQRNASH
jgi:hypothetical protein